MASKLTLLGSAILGWAIVVALCAVPLAESRMAWVIVPVALAAATAGLVLSIIGAAQYERY
jgi:hypothetical protein